MSLAVGSASRTPSGFERLPGVSPPSSRVPRSGFLTDTLAEMGLVDPELLEAAIVESRVRSIPPESLLVQQGQLNEADLARARAERAGLDYVDLDVFEIDPDAGMLLGRQAAERFRALPLAIQGRMLIVALADPVDGAAISEVAALTQLDVIPVVAAAEAIVARVDALPERDLFEEAPAPEPIPLQSVSGGRRASDRAGGEAAPPALPETLTDQIVQQVQGALNEVARSELLKALDDATGEIEQLSTKLEQTEQRAQALERERDELRAELDS